MILIPTLITLATLHSITAETRSKRQNDGCTTPNGEAGNCISIRSCQALLTLLKKAPQDPEAASFVRRYKCGGYSEVCCPREVKTKPSNQTSGKLPEVCGRVASQDSRIVGGVPAELGAWPWIAALGYKYKSITDLQWRCGGSLINNRYVLTAAHCIRLSPLYRDLKLEKVRLGEHNLYSDSDGANPIDYGIEKTVVHEDYRSQANDIGLIRLDQDVFFTDKIKPICLPQAASLRSSTFEKKYPFVVGWGEINMGGNSSDILLQVQVPVVDNNSCKIAYAKLGGVITDSQICAGEQKGGKDSCRGDSGGPLMLPETGAYYQIGIISFGHKCAEPGYPGVYTRVTSYLDWITINME